MVDKVIKRISIRLYFLSRHSKNNFELDIADLQLEKGKHGVISRVKIIEWLRKPATKVEHFMKNCSEPI